MKNETEEMTMEEYYGQYSHAGYEVLEGDIIRRLEEIKKLSDEDKAFELSCLSQEIFIANGEQYPIEIIDELINKNSEIVWR